MAADWELRAHPEYGFRQVHPTPSAAEISQYYEQEFYSGDYQQLNDSSLEIQVRDQEFYDAQRADVCRIVGEIVGRDVAGLSLLDVGCGWGQALLYFRDQGMDCYGFDPAPEAVAHASKLGLKVREAAIDSMDVFDGRQFDTITMFNVLEHLADPVAAVRQVRERVIAERGVLVIDVPNEFNAFQTCGRDVHGLPDWWVAPPAHLNYFSGSTLQQMLEGEGYEVCALRSSFPMEMFLLFGENYVADGALGRRCHERRMAFESNLRECGQAGLLDDLYTYFAERDLGRQVIAFARPR
jgi:2-polyprenyl-3-methyl-5-hydroxy-6-metoxy-1,4-benzoquinol methylase